MTPWTIARQTPLSMGFPRQEYTIIQAVISAASQQASGLPVWLKSVWLGLSLSSHSLSSSLSTARHIFMKPRRTPLAMSAHCSEASGPHSPACLIRHQMSSTGGNLLVQATEQPCLPSPIVPDMPWKISGYINEIKNENHTQAKQRPRVKHYYVGLLPTPPRSLMLPSRKVTSCLGLNPSPWQKALLRWSFIKNPLRPRSEHVLPSSEPPGQSLSRQTITFHFQGY